MTIDPELETQILRLHFAERWRVNTIALQLGVHHSTVSRVLSQAGVPKARRANQASILDPYTPMIIETLEQYPTLSAARLYAMAQERGFGGSSGHFRAYVAQLRPRKRPEAFLRLNVLPAEQCQVDWAHFQYIKIGRAKRPLMAFVMVMSWSRKIFLRFYLNQKLDNFIRGHVEAFERFQGVARIILYDNLKAAVLERRGQAIRFHPTMLDLAAQYRFEPRPVAVARGNEKGRVERAIRYIRSSFFAGRRWRDLDDLNAQADLWCKQISGERRCPQEPDLTVNQAFELEQPKLIALPDNPFNTDERLAVRVGKTPYARYDLNDYSLPPKHVRCTLTVVASLTQVRLFDAEQCVAQHPRCFGKGEQIEDPQHIEQLIIYKQQGRHHSSYDRLAMALPEATPMIELAAGQALPLSPLVSALLKLLDRYGVSEMQHAIHEAMSKELPNASAVEQVLARRRDEQQIPPPIPIALPPTMNRFVVRTANLAHYDDLTPVQETPDDTQTDE